MPITTALLITFTLLTIIVVWIAVLYTFLSHHLRLPATRVYSVRHSWLVEMAWACMPWVIVILLIYPTLEKIFMQT
jgi:heme/copper-type cytochrome/quinol oxidase subunit 2